MEKIFGIPANNLAIVMAILLIVIFVVVIFGAVRRFILFKMGTRNIPRRKGQSLLIVIGLMLSSIIIATSLGIGDTIRYSIRFVVVDSLGIVDEVIEGPGKQLFGEEYFDYSEFTYVQNITKDNTNIDQLIPYIQTTLPSSNEQKDIAESNMNIRGIDFNYIDQPFENLDGKEVSKDLLGPNSVFINYDAGKILKLTKGDTLQIYTNKGPNNFIVEEVLKSGGLTGGSSYPYVTFELSTLQKLLDKENKITNIGVSNIGDGDESLEYSDDVTKFLRSQLTNNDVASEIFDLLKSDDIPKFINKEAEEAVRSGFVHLILTDKSLSKNRVAIPMILVTSSVHHYLIMKKLRTFVSLNIQSAECMDVQYFAVLIGVGATSINAYLAQQAIAERHKKGLFKNLSYEECVEKYIQSINNGLLKIMSKMGISVVSSYRGGCNFEAIGLSRNLMSQYFPSMSSKISGMGLAGLERRSLDAHRKAFEDDFITLPIGGFYSFRKGGEKHSFEATSIHILQSAVGSDSYTLYKKYVDYLLHLKLLY